MLIHRDIGRILLVPRIILAFAEFPNLSFPLVAVLIHESASQLERAVSVTIALMVRMMQLSQHLCHVHKISFEV